MSHRSPPRRVLIVEDDGDWREAIAEYLREAHVEVHCVGTAEDAMDVLTSGAALPDVVVIDIGLPHEDGYELLRRIRASGDPLRSIPAIAVTAYAGLDYQRQALNSGFDLFRTKPIAPEGVALAILELSSRFRSGAAPAVTAMPPAAPEA